MSELKTNIYIGADDDGISISGLTNMEYLHILHILKQYVINKPSGSGILADFNNDIVKTALNVLKRGAIVYGPYES
jgi:hypothetical protein